MNPKLPKKGISFKKSSALKKRYHFVFFNVVNIGIILGVLSKSLKANLYGLTTNMDYIVARKTLGGHDSGSYLEGSLQLLGLSATTEQNNFVWQLWPPGMQATLTLLSKVGFIFQHAILAGVIIQIISLLIIQNNLRIMIAERSFALSQIFPIVFLAFFSPYRDWVLGYGLLYAEGPALAFLTSSIVFLYKRERILDGTLKPFRFKSFVLTDKWLLGCSGFAFGVAAYFRGPIDAMLQACFAAWIIFIFPIKLRGTPHKSFSSTAIFFGLYLLVTLPWRIFSFLNYKIPVFKWTSLSGDANWAYIPNEELIRNGQEAWAHGNLNWACEIVDKDCGHSVQHGLNDLFQVILNHPLEFLTLRIPQLVKTLALPGSQLYPWAGTYNYLQSAFWLFSVSVLIFFFVLRVLRNRINFVDFIIVISVMSTLLLVLLTHFENRYFLPATVLMVMFFGSYRRSNTSNDRHPTKIS